MLKKNLSKSALVVALLTTTVIWRGTTAYAEDPNQAFTLDPMIVTAQRTETRDLDTPATTNIITEQNIKEAGYKNVFDAIEHQVGLTSTGYGDAGQDFGFSSGRTVIRGYDRGTLVMVDGIPMNLKNPVLFHEFSLCSANCTPFSLRSAPTSSSECTAAATRSFPFHPASLRFSA